MSDSHTLAAAVEGRAYVDALFTLARLHGSLTQARDNLDLAREAAEADQQFHADVAVLQEAVYAWEDQVAKAQKRAQDKHAELLALTGAKGRI